MGTSQSSKGPGSKLPIVPPWVSDPDNGNGSTVSGEAPEQPVQASEQQILLAPARRFADARRSIGSFAKTGNKVQMKKALGSYVRTSYGGAKTVAKRHANTSRTAVTLYDILSPQNAREAIERIIERPIFEGQSAEELMNAIVEATRPVDGTQDAEANRRSIKDALADLLEKFPNADLLQLSEEERMFAAQQYIFWDIFKRFQLDLGTAIHNKAPDIATALTRLKEVRDYIKETVSATFNKLQKAGEKPDKNTVGRIINSALKETFDIFSSYTE